MNDETAQTPPENTPNLPATAGERALTTLQGAAQKWLTRFDYWADYIAPRNDDEKMAPENVARGSILSGLLMGLAIFVVFGLWAAIAPIDSAAIAPGKVVLDSNKKTINHLEGGIVEEILVSEGMAVKEGQPLLRLDNTAAKARYDLYRGQFVAAQASEARLVAERDNLDEVTFPQSLLDMEADDAHVATSIDSQRRLFKTRREALEGKESVLGQKVKQLDEEIKGLEEQIKSANTQLDLLNEEIRDVRHLLKSGNAPKTRLLALERRSAEIVGERGENQARISRAMQAINEAKIETLNLRTNFLNDVVTELRETQVKLSDLEEQLRASENVVSRIVINSPIAGAVTGLAVHTVGATITPNSALMNIVPFDDKLIVEAKVRPDDIDVVRVGLEARVRLVAFKVRNVPPVEGRVITVSADRFEDQRTGETYYTARVEIDEDQLHKLGNVTLQPGMPTEVLIVTGSRSFFSYLFSPISDSFNRSFREQ